MSKTSLDQDAQVPALGVFQFDASSVGQGVNLFRGNLAFPLKLLSLPGRNGLTLDATLLYHGNVQHSVDAWNLESPTDIVGFGWNMPCERIVMGPRQSGSDIDATYFLIDEGTTQPLIPILHSWSRGRLDPANVQSLRTGPVDSNLAAALRSSGISIDDNAQLTAGPAANQWLLHDPSRERVYRLQSESAGGPIEVSTAGQSFELDGYRFWQIVYYADYQTWEIVKEDGSAWSYGGSGSPIETGHSPNTVQWGIRWGNWNGTSSAAQGQQRYVKAWNLARIENTVGNSIVFNYSVTEQTVGSGTLTYTKECHLLEARNDLGWSFFFSYRSMTYDSTAMDAPKEYLDPHKDPSTPPSNPDAYQSVYNTQYL